ncbi:MAG: ABC transporter permease [Gemmatimonadales bacterium]
MRLLARFAVSKAGASIVAAVLALAVVALVVYAGGYDIARAAAALWSGAAGSTYSFFSGTLLRATPLIIVGLSVAVAFQAGVLNIGAEGQLLAGASATIAVGLAAAAWPGWILVPAELAAGMVAGAAWAGVAAVLKQRFGVLEVISTLMLNFVALYGVSYLVHGPFQEPTHTYPLTPPLGEAARLPVIVPGQQLHLGFVAALVLAVAAWWFVRSTAGGFRLRLVGAGAAAAASAGRVRVERVVFGAFLWSGAIAGLGGAVQVTGVTYRLFEGISPGYGYTAIAVALLARLNPLAVIVAGIFFGGLEAGGAGMQRDAGVPAGFVNVIEALVILGVLAVERARALAAERTRSVAGEQAA